MSYTITIGRQYGSGGREIGKIVAQELGIPFYDRELIELAAKQSGISAQLFETYDEKPGSLLFNLSVGSYPFGGFSGIGDIPISDKLYLIQSDIIKGLAAKEPCVIVGRCSDYILKNNPGVLNMFINCDFKTRVSRIVEAESLTIAQATDEIKKTDRQRASYHNYFSDTKWSDLASYDFCINSKFGIKTTANIIINIHNSL